SARRGTPSTTARYSFSTRRPANWRESAMWVASSLATTSRPEVPRSSRWTMPGRSTPPTPERSRTRCRRAFTSVPDARPAPGCTTRPAGWPTTRGWRSSGPTGRGMSSGRGTAGAGAGRRTDTVWPALSRRAGRAGRPSTTTPPWAMTDWSRARLRSGRRAASHRSSRSPAPASSTARVRASASAVTKASGRGGGGLGGVLPEHGGVQEEDGEDHQDGDELRRGQPSAEHHAAGGVAAVELDREAGGRVEEDVGESDLALEALAAGQPDQDEEDGQRRPRLVELRRVQ